MKKKIHSPSRTFPYLVILAFLCLSIISCERDSNTSNSGNHILKGQLVQSCKNLKGIDNVHLTLFLDKAELPTGGSGAERIAEAFTDAKGNFELTYQGDIKDNIYLETYPETNKSPRRLMMGIPKNKNLDLGYVYNSPDAVYLVMKASTHESYSAQDTLSMGNAAAIQTGGIPERRKIAGPFTEGQILAEIPDHSAGVQIYEQDTKAPFDNMDTDFLFTVSYYFTSKDTRFISYVITSPCKQNVVEISLDSLETK